MNDTSPKTSTILLDYSTGIQAAVHHLVELGHQKIAFLAGPHKLHSAITRETTSARQCR